MSDPYTHTLASDQRYRVAQAANDNPSGHAFHNMEHFHSRPVSSWWLVLTGAVAVGIGLWVCGVWG